MITPSPYLCTLFPLIPIVHQFQFYEDCGANHVSLCLLSYTYLLADFLTLSPVCDFSGAQEREENSDSESISNFPSSATDYPSLSQPNCISMIAKSTTPIQIGLLPGQCHKILHLHETARMTDKVLETTCVYKECKTNLFILSHLNFQAHMSLCIISVCE